MKYYLLLCLLLSGVLGFGQQNENLAKIIDSLKVEDQKFRHLARELRNNNPDDTLSLQKAYAEMRRVDSLVQQEAKLIFRTYGFPGENLVGKQSCHNYWLLVQHCDSDPDFQEAVLAAMLVEVKKDNASARDYAYLLDRVKVNTGKLQVYATQMILNADSSSFVPQPMIDPERIDERREEMGLGKLEYYIQTMNSRYFGALKKEEE